MRGQRLQARLTHGFFFLAGRTFILDEAESLKTPDEFAFDRHLAIFVHIGHHGLLLLEPAQEHGCAPVHKSLGQTLVQRIRQAVFYRACFAAPMAFVIDPAFSLRNISPGPNIGETFRQRVNVSVGPVDAPDLAGEPIDGNMTALVNIAEDRLQ